MQTIKSAQMAEAYAFTHSCIMDGDATFIRERLELHCEDVPAAATASNPVQLLGVAPYP